MTTLTSLAELQRRLDPLLPILLLIDPLAGEPLEVASDAEAIDQARAQAWGRPVVAIELHQSVDLLPYQRPYLVVLRNIRDEWLAASLDMAHDEHQVALADGLGGEGMVVHRVGGWLQCPQGAERLAQRLSLLSQVNTDVLMPGARYVRMADRRVIDWLRIVVGDERVATAISPAACWLYLDQSGRIDGLPVATDTPPSRLRLTVAEWADFIRGPELHAAAARWLGQLALDGQSGPEDRRDRYARLLSAHAEAERAAKRWPALFKSPQDRAAWMALDLLHPRLADRSPICVHLNACNQAIGPEATTLHDLCDSIRTMLTDETTEAPR